MARKVPQTIIHEKVLHNGDSEFKAFLSAADILGEQLGLLLFQFGYFNKNRTSAREGDEVDVRLVRSE